MMKLWTLLWGDKEVPTNDRRPDAATPVETNSKDDYFPINALPPEVLFLILIKLDEESLFHSYFVCRRWRSIVFDMANRDKTNRIWLFLYRQYQLEGYYYQQNSDSCSLLPFQELLETSLKWKNKICSVKLSNSVPVIDAVQMTLYREHITLVTSAGVEYYDKDTFRFKKRINIDKCQRFIENDYMVARSIQHANSKIHKLKLFGKSHFDDCEWESQFSTYGKTQSTTEELDVQLFKLDEHRCFVVNMSNALYSYDWKYTKTPMEWQSHFRCGYACGDVFLAMNVGRKQIYLLNSYGELYVYQREKPGALEKIYTYSGFARFHLFQLVHRNNIVLGVPVYQSGCVARISGLHQTRYPILYRLEFRTLTCVTEHGVLLFLGFSDGTIRIMSPMDEERKRIPKHSIDLSVLSARRADPVLSIEVHVETDGKQSLLVATASYIYRLLATFPDENNIYDMENRVGLVREPSVDLARI